MIVSINGEERDYDAHYAKWADKWYPAVKKWYVIFTIICLINLGLYIAKIHTNWNLVVYLPFVHCPVSFLFLMLLPYVTGLKRSDYTYIDRYYPEVSKKIWVGGIDNGIMNKIENSAFYGGAYIDEGADSIIDKMRNRKQSPVLYFYPLLLSVVICIAAEFFRELQ
ncbi:MAG: hypothetical protein Ta2A_14430 [Treponemataceae bacterium]|nr:MAG: hypothetical protein Ta2A_14430 [Treponemataceae bacterium]